MSKIATAIGALAAGSTAAAQAHPVIELRQYKIVEGQRDQFVELFDREFVETQEAEGMELIGQFRDRTDPDRFTWIRAFPGMDSRQRALTAFYSGPTWLAHRSTANPMLLDNDNVLLLRAAWPGSGFNGVAERQVADDTRPARLAIITIHYLWKDPGEGFTAFFKHRFAPALTRAGVSVDAALVRENSANNFPRLPVREGEKLFVWATTVAGEAAWQAALARLHADADWPAIRKQLFDYEERAAQRLMLDPTLRSRLR